MNGMYEMDFPSRQALIGVIAAVRAKSPLSQPARVDILLTQGLDALLEEVFGAALFHPERDAALDQAERDLSSWREKGYQVTSILEPTYPYHLAGVHEAPAVLFSVGALNPVDNGVSVVGSRHAPPGQLQAARDIATALVRRELTVVSGLAAGIDAAISDQRARILRAEMKYLGVEPPPVIDNAKEAAPSARPRSLR